MIFFNFKIKKEILEWKKISVEHFDAATLIAISDCFKISLLNEVSFYTELFAKLRDFNEILECQKNTAEKTISLEVGKEITIYLGSTAFVRCKSLHEAIWKVLMYHVVFCVPTPEDLRNTAGFFGRIFHWPFFETTEWTRKKANEVMLYRSRTQK